MGDDLIGTKEVADRLRVSVATINRWASDPAEGPLTPAMEIPGPAGRRPAARLYRRSDVEELWESRIGRALAAGACDRCTNWNAQEKHLDGVCPLAEQVAS
jgi:hypothetical protein